MSYSFRPRTQYKARKGLGLEKEKEKKLDTAICNYGAITVIASRLAGLE